MNSLRVIFAVDDEAERSAFATLASAAEPPFIVHFPVNIAEVEALYSRDEAEAIVTDFRFHGGALADWLTFWPLPTVLLLDAGDDLERVEHTTRDEASIFVERRADGGHLRLLPILVRKVVNIRESVKRQNAHLQMTEHQYLNLIQAIPDIVYILDGEGKFVYLNDAIRSLGYEPARLIGRHFSVIIHPEDVANVSRVVVLESFRGSVTGPEGAPKLFDERRSGTRMTKNLELRLRVAPGFDQGRNAKPEPGAEAAASTEGPAPRAGEVAYGSVSAYGEVSCSGYRLPEFEGRGLGTVGIIRDVTRRKEQERELQETLAARELRLKEIHHRVKNNLQVVSSLLSLQETSLEDEAARGVFLECQTQIQSMAMVHDELYRGTGMQRVDMQKYFEELLDYLSVIYEGNLRRVTWSVEAHSVSLDLDGAIPVALIVNELVSNSFKHAFSSSRGGNILVRMVPNEGQWLLTVSDDGRGFAASGSGDSRGPAAGPAAGPARGDTGAEAGRRRGIGTELVLALSAQLKGSAEFLDDGGGVARVVFPRE